MACMESAKLGKARRIDDAAGRYIEFCKSTFPNDLDLRGLKIVVDSAHGAAYHVAPNVFHELGAEIVGVGDTPNGLNINHEVGATAPEALRRTVLETGADCGIALDGDGDRLVMVDAAGQVYDGDQLLYVIARHVRARNPDARRRRHPDEQSRLRACPGPARHRAGPGQGRRPLCAGDDAGQGLEFGGENSGHIICLDRHTTGDGIIAACRYWPPCVGERDAGRGLRRSALYPQRLINVRMPAGFDWKADAGIKAAVEAAEVALDGKGRTLLRPSGTEPLLRVMVEGATRRWCNVQAEAIALAYAELSKTSRAVRG
jgi:phosphoglucosamine mutase